MRQKVVLLDELGEAFGKEHIFHNLRTPLDAIRLLTYNHPKFAEHLIESEERGIGYKVIQGGEALTLPETTLPFGTNDLIIAPVVTGSGSSFEKILVGTILIGAAFIFAPAAGTGFLGWAGSAGAGYAALSKTLGYLGVSLILGGVSQALAPMPAIPDISASRFNSGDSIATDGPQSATRGSDGRQSYAFTGPANTVGIGATIPVIYGKVIAGSHLISARIKVTDDSRQLGEYVKTPGDHTIRIGGQKPLADWSLASGLLTKRVTGFSQNNTNYAPMGKSSFEPAIQTVQLRGPDSAPFYGNDPGTDHPANEFQIALRIQNGLYDYSNNVDGTKVDGYFTYTIKITNRDLGSEPLVGSATTTIQGLLSPNSTWIWMHQFKFGNIQDKLRYNIEFQIDDARSADSTRLEVLRVGYRLAPPYVSASA